MVARGGPSPGRSGHSPAHAGAPPGRREGCFRPRSPSSTRCGCPSCRAGSVRPGLMKGVVRPARSSSSASRAASVTVEPRATNSRATRRPRPGPGTRRSPPRTDLPGTSWRKALSWTSWRNSSRNDLSGTNSTLTARCSSLSERRAHVQGRYGAEPHVVGREGVRPGWSSCTARRCRPSGVGHRPCPSVRFGEHAAIPRSPAECTP